MPLSSALNLTQEFLLWPVASFQSKEGWLIIETNLAAPVEGRSAARTPALGKAD
jgi:hypothetical protein